MSRGTLDQNSCYSFSLTWLLHFIAKLSSFLQLMKSQFYVLSATPTPLGAGLGSFPFARRYLGNRFFFLFLQVLRCFSSLSLPPYTYLFSVQYTVLTVWVAPFGNLRITGYLRLPEAYRSLSRPSSAPSAKAFTMRSS